MSDLTPVQNNFSSDAVQYAKKASYYAPSTGGGAGSGGVTQIVVNAVDLTGSVTLEGQNGVTVTQNGSGVITVDGTLGGVTSIVAGTGVTIDPVSGLGAVTVNATASAPPALGVGYVVGTNTGTSIALTSAGVNMSGSNTTLMANVDLLQSYGGYFTVHIAGLPGAGSGSSPATQPGLFTVIVSIGGLGPNQVVYRPAPLMASAGGWEVTVPITINTYSGAGLGFFGNKTISITITPTIVNGDGSLTPYTTFVPTLPTVSAYIGGFLVPTSSQTIA